MKIVNTLFVLVFFLFFNYSCEEDIVEMNEGPEIDLNIEEAFPLNCDTIYFGERFGLVALFKDVDGLASWGYEFHHNFDHHLHSNVMSECNHEVTKEPQNAFSLIFNSKISGIKTEFKPNIYVHLTSENSEGILYDEGNYHLIITVTESTGLAASKLIDVIMLHK